MPPKRPAQKKRNRASLRILRAALLVLAGAYGLVALSLLYLRWLPPITTAVHIERRIQARWHGKTYHKRYDFVPLARISLDLRHAVIAAEDTRFYQHHGFDWVEIGKVVGQDLERRHLGRGASTITQQLVKNLYLTTSRSLVRKGLEFALVPLAEWILPKDRILELYLNVIEWGPAVYGAEAAARYHYGIRAAQVSRLQAAALAAIIPAPLSRKPARMDNYSREILARMQSMGW